MTWKSLLTCWARWQSLPRPSVFFTSFTGWGADMTQGQYMRVETDAGGMGCTYRAFVRAAWGMLSPEGKRQGARAARHIWIRDGLDKLESARRQARIRGLT